MQRCRVNRKAAARAVDQPQGCFLEFRDDQPVALPGILAQLFDALGQLDRSAELDGFETGGVDVFAQWARSCRFACCTPIDSVARRVMWCRQKELQSLRVFRNLSLRMKTILSNDENCRAALLLAQPGLAAAEQGKADKAAHLEFTAAVDNFHLSAVDRASLGIEYLSPAWYSSPCFLRPHINVMPSTG